MSLRDKRYSGYSLVSEVLQSSSIIRSFDPRAVQRRQPSSTRVILTGEGSSRIFPGKLARYSALVNGDEVVPTVEGATQTGEYDLADTELFVASNSGKTSECVHLLRELNGSRSNTSRSGRVSRSVGITQNPESPVATESEDSYILACGEEQAVAATKSVIEQALFYDTLFASRASRPAPDQSKLADQVEEVFELTPGEELVSVLASAPLLYFAGRNNGVAEELRLKANEIARKKSDFLEGTYAVHGVEEVMRRDEAVLFIDPPAQFEQKLHKELVEGVGLNVVAIASRDTIFPTFRIPNAGDRTAYLQLVAGWSMLVAIGHRSGIDLDKPERARKVGHEFQDDSGNA